MQGSFEYFATTTYMDSITISNIGECCIQATNDLGEAYYLYITTNLGRSKVLEYGPEIDGLSPSYLICRYQEFNYSDKKLDRIIRNFINDPSKNVTQVFETSFNDIKTKLTDPKEFMDEHN